MNDKQQLIQENINLVHFLISKQYPNYRFDDDMVQCGMLGLCLAAENYDPKRGKFSAYARKFILGEINREFQNRKAVSKNVSLETRVGDELRLEDVIVDEDDIAYMDDAFYEQLTDDELTILQLDNRGFTTDEIADKSGFNVQKVQKLLRITRKKWRKFNDD